MKLTHYQPFLKKILSKIHLARYEMLKTVSKQTVALYWEIGKAVSEKVNNEKWGKSVVEQLLDNYEGDQRILANALFLEILRKLSNRMLIELGEMPNDLNHYLAQELSK